MGLATCSQVYTKQNLLLCDSQAPLETVTGGGRWGVWGVGLGQGACRAGVSELLEP